MLPNVVFTGTPLTSAMMFLAFSKMCIRDRLQDLQTRNERLFLVTILIMNTATNRQKLENAVFQTAAIAQKYDCALKRLDFQQEEGLMSSLPDVYKRQE